MRILRYPKGVTVGEAETPTEIGFVSYGDWTVYETTTASWRGTTFTLPGGEHRLLEHLVLHGGTVSTKSQLLTYLETDANAKIVDVYFCHLKTKIRRHVPLAEPELKTYWGRGYGCMKPNYLEPPLCPVLPESMGLLTYPQRWTLRLKKEVVKAIKENRANRAEVMELNHISEYEMSEWEVGMVSITRDFNATAKSTGVVGAWGKKRLRL